LHDLASGVLVDPVSQLLRNIGAELRAAKKEPDSASLSSGLLVAAVIRNTSLLGLMILEQEGDKYFSDKDMQTAETAVAIVIMLLEKRATLALFQSVQHPVDFLLPLDAFLDELLFLVREGTGMRYVALRELQPDRKTLKCLSVFGFSEVDKSIFDLISIENYPKANLGRQARRVPPAASLPAFPGAATGPINTPKQP